MKNLFKRTVCSLLALSAALCFASCGEPATAKDPEYYVPEKETTADVTAPVIKTSYEYKIVMVNQEATLPTVEFSEAGVTASYTLDGETVEQGGAFTPTETGVKIFEVTAKDGAGNKATPKKVKITVTDDEADLNKIYALDIAEGLQAHVGTARSGLNHLVCRHIGATDARPEDMYGEEIPSVTYNGENISDSFIYLNNYTNNGRMLLNAPLYTRWNEKFEQLYFYFYNGGENTITLNFNNYKQDIAAGAKGKKNWVKVILAPKTVTVQGDDPTTSTVETSYQKIVTDYTQISSLGGSASLEGLFDLTDCQGAFLTITTKIQFEPMAMSAIYGVPVKEAK